MLCFADAKAHIQFAYLHANAGKRSQPAGQFIEFYDLGSRLLLLPG